jgi:hypothetical protein
VNNNVFGKVFIDNNVGSLPQNGIFRGSGTRIILFPGSASATPFALGYDTYALWYGAQSAGNHIFHTETTERLRIRVIGRITDPAKYITSWKWWEIKNSK